MHPKNTVTIIVNKKYQFQSDLTYTKYYLDSQYNNFLIFTLKKPS